MSDTPIINLEDAPEESLFAGDHWGQHYRVLTPSMGERMGRLGVNCTRLPPGRVACPFHAHQREDEVFYVLSGRGVLRYGDALYPLRPGDCVSCPAGSGEAHQIANPYDEDLIYLAIGPNDAHEVCTYPDSGKVMIRSLQAIGRLEKTGYMDGEPDRPRILDLIQGAGL
ncbi:MAG: cupin domain-containing protein [Alphaproteobacteria bacterium]|nr:cupin domain-containing protein [Alphaproteobacteria bacterium]